MDKRIGLYSSNLDKLGNPTPVCQVHGGPVGVGYLYPRDLSPRNANAEGRNVPKYAKLRDHKDLITVVPRTIWRLKKLQLRELTLNHT